MTQLPDQESSLTAGVTSNKVLATTDTFLQFQNNCDIHHFKLTAGNEC